MFTLTDTLTGNKLRIPEEQINRMTIRYDGREEGAHGFLILCQNKDLSDNNINNGKGQRGELIDLIF